MPVFRRIKSEQAPRSSSNTMTKSDKQHHADAMSTIDSNTDTDKDNGENSDSTHDNDSKTKPGYNKPVASPPSAEEAKQIRAAIPYKEPSWGGLATRKYSFDVLKNGSIIDSIDLSDKSFYIFGRLPTCDVTLEHPSLSRYHACIQHCATPTERNEAGWYLYDLDSTHGTWINKVKVQPKVYHRIRVGHVIKFGGSTRLFILQGPADDQEEESQLSVTELRMQREKHKRETELLRQEEMDEDPNEVISRDDGCMWGIDMSNVTDEYKENPFAQSLDLDETFYIDDPKKALKGYLDREGFDAPEYETTSEGPGKFRCSIELPVDDINGRPIVAVASVVGKKREAVEACALEACRILDRQGVLRASTHESRKRKKKNWEENDFYDSDEDTFLDRTGTIEKKREQRMKKAGKVDDETETYESLSEKHAVVVAEIQEIEEKLEKAKTDAAAMESSEDMDALDAYMQSIKSGVMDAKTRMKLKRRLLEIRPQEQRLRKLVNLTRPVSLPELKPFIYQPKADTSTVAALPKGLPCFGKMKSKNVPKTPKVFTVAMPTMLEGNDEPEMEEEESSDEEMETSQAKRTPMETDQKDPGHHRLEKTTKDSQRSPPTHLQKGERSKVMAAAEYQKSKSSEQLPHHDKISMNVASLKKSTVASSPEFSSSTKNTKNPSKFPGSLAFSREMLLKEQKKSNKGKNEANFDEDAEKVVWLPPSNQTGDGRTSLNDKYGY